MAAFAPTALAEAANILESASLLGNVPLAKLLANFCGFHGQSSLPKEAVCAVRFNCSDDDAEE